MSSPDSAMNAFPFEIERVFVSDSAATDTLTERVLSRLPRDIKVTYLEDRGDPLSELKMEIEPGVSSEELSDAERYSLGKKWLLLTRSRGVWLKRCPGTLRHVCCNLWVINPAEGCPLDCTYCCLQQYLRRNPTLKLFTNTGAMLREIEEKVGEEPSRLFRVCTGELTDSMVWDALTDLSLDLVPMFGRLPNALLELKTKHSYVDNLVSLAKEHKGRTIVSWSVNARSVVKADEALTASLDARIAAARRVIEAGYRVGLHFDPLVYFSGWEDEYSDTIRLIFSEIKPENVAWVSIAPLRYHPEQQKMMIERFVDSRLPFGEQFLAGDNKLRIVQPLRLKMIRFVWNALKAIKSDLPVYMCMESSAAWRAISGGPPVSDPALNEVYSRRCSDDSVCSCV